MVGYYNYEFLSFRILKFKLPNLIFSWHNVYKKLSDLGQLNFLNKI